MCVQIDVQQWTLNNFLTQNKCQVGIRFAKIDAQQWT